MDVCCLFETTTSILLIINITPGSIGIREIIVGIISSFTGGSFDVGLIAAGLYRVVATFVHIALGFPGLAILRKNKII